MYVSVVLSLDNLYLHPMGTVDRRGQQNSPFVMLMGLAKQFEACFFADLD